MKSIAESIKLVREKHQLSQARFGSKIGVSGKTVSAYENGKCVPPLKVLEKISEVYSVSILTTDELLINKIRKLQEELIDLSKLIQLQLN